LKPETRLPARKSLSLGENPGKLKSDNSRDQTLNAQRSTLNAQRWPGGLDPDCDV